MRTKYSIAYSWYNHSGNGNGRCEVYYSGTVSGADDLEKIEDMIRNLPNHAGKNTKIVITNWQPFERAIRDRKITRLALAKGLRYC